MGLDCKSKLFLQNLCYLLTYSLTFYNKGTLVDPYNCDFDLIRNQKHIVELPENVDDVINYDGQIKINVTNGDSFSGNFQDGEREGFGVLTFGLIHQRYSIVKDSNANSGVIFIKCSKFSHNFGYLAIVFYF